MADSRKNTNTVPTTVFSLALDTHKGLLGLFITKLISCEDGNATLSECMLLDKDTYTYLPILPFYYLSH